MCALVVCQLVIYSADREEIVQVAKFKLFATFQHAVTVHADNVVVVVATTTIYSYFYMLI